MPASSSCTYWLKSTKKEKKSFWIYVGLGHVWGVYGNICDTFGVCVASWASIDGCFVENIWGRVDLVLYCFGLLCVELLLRGMS